MKIRILLLIFCSLYLYSCTSSETATTTTAADISFEELKIKVNNNSQKLTSLDADGEISIESPNLSNTGSITASIKKPDSIFIKLEGPFGIDIANLLITRNDFVYYNVQENRVIRGPSTQKNLGIIMRIKLDFDDILNSFSGKFTFNDDKYKEVKINADGNNYIIILTFDNETRKYWVDKDNFYVTRLKTMDTKGDTKVEIVYDNFYEANDIFFPKKITINRPRENQNIWLSYSKEEFNREKLSYKLKIPKSAKLITWQ